MWSTARDIAPGDLVIVWQTRDHVRPLLVTPGRDLHSRFGHYRHDDLVGVPYGSRVASRGGFIHLLRPTPELWTIALPHRTQILYLADIAFITAWLDVRPGSRVVEAGTGSGSFSHSVARTIGASGHLYSYEFHEARAEKAREEFVRHGIQDTVTLTHRNVCKDGFTVEDLVDAVFLDLPAPWDAIEHAKKALRKDCPTRICCFSPCMEQVLRTVSTLNEAGFTDVTMYETLLRPHQVQQRPPPRPISDIVDKLKDMERYREEKRQRQISSTGKRKRDPGASAGEMDVERTAVEDGMTEKRARVVPRVHQAGDERAASQPETVPPPEEQPTADGGGAGPSPVHCSKVSPDVRGHTSYLTFARLVPMPTHAA